MSEDTALLGAGGLCLELGVVEGAFASV